MEFKRGDKVRVVKENLAWPAIFVGDVGRVQSMSGTQVVIQVGLNSAWMENDEVEPFKEDQDLKQPAEPIPMKSVISITDLHALRSSGFTTDEIVKLKKEGLL